MCLPWIYTPAYNGQRLYYESTRAFSVCKRENEIWLGHFSFELDSFFHLNTHTCTQSISISTSLNCPYHSQLFWRNGESRSTTRGRTEKEIDCVWNERKPFNQHKGSCFYSLICMFLLVLAWRDANKCLAMPFVHSICSPLYASHSLTRTGLLLMLCQKRYSNDV